MGCLYLSDLWDQHISFEHVHFALTKQYIEYFFNVNMYLLLLKLVVVRDPRDFTWFSRSPCLDIYKLYKSPPGLGLRFQRGQWNFNNFVRGIGPWQQLPLVCTLVNSKPDHHHSTVCTISSWGKVNPYFTDWTFPVWKLAYKTNFIGHHAHVQRDVLACSHSNCEPSLMSPPTWNHTACTCLKAAGWHY